MSSSPALLLREEILAGLDPRMEELGFTRRKRFHGWFSHPSPEVVQAFHLNFGRTTGTNPLFIVPSVATGIETVTRELLSAAVIKSSKDACTFSYQLRTLLGVDYTAYTDQGAAPMVTRLIADFRRHGLPRLAALSSLESVAKLMLSPDTKDWPVMWLSMRARILPVVVALLGQTKEAHAWLTRLRADLNGRDQLQPGIDHFAAWFATRFGQAA